MTNTHINVGGHKITTNKVGQVHDVTSKLQSGFSANYEVTYVVTNGICTISMWGFKGTTTGSGQTILKFGDYPTPKQNYLGIVYNGSNGQPIIIIYNDLFYSGSKDMKGTVVTANAVGYCSFSYPVADDWVES